MPSKTTETKRHVVLPRTPHHGYKGPVRYVIPGRAAHVDMFCPRCGSTYLERVGFDAFVHQRTETFNCHGCGATFKLAQYANNNDKRFTVMYGDRNVGEDLTMMEMNTSAINAVSDAIRARDKRYWRLASDYYGTAYSDLISDWDDDPEGVEKTMQDIESIIPATEYGYCQACGYFDGMDVGDEVRLPDVPLSIVRTNNTKKRKERRWRR